MGDASKKPFSLWELLCSLPPELQIAVVRSLSPRSRHWLRASSKHARTIANRAVSLILLSITQADELESLELHLRFPNARKLEFDDHDGELLSDSHFAAYCEASLQHHTSIVELDLWRCSKLGAAAALALSKYCGQLESVRLPDTYHVNDAALRQTSDLTRLTLLNVTGSSIAKLKPLERLKGLKELLLMNCPNIADDSLQPLRSLAALTRLDLSNTGVTGTGLAGLTGLKELEMWSCKRVNAAGAAVLASLTSLHALDLTNTLLRQPAALLMLTALTGLQKLALSGHIIKDDLLHLLDLPGLTYLYARTIRVPSSSTSSSSTSTSSTNSRGHARQIKQLYLQDPAAAELAALLPLPSLDSLTINEAVGTISSSIARQQQLTHFSLGRLYQPTPAELASTLQALSHLQCLQLGKSCGRLDMRCMLAIAGMKQLQELFLVGSSELPFTDAGPLLQCQQLREVSLHRCGIMPRYLLMMLACKPGMKRVAISQLPAKCGRPGCRCGVCIRAHHAGIDWEQAQLVADQMGVEMCLEDLRPLPLGVPVEEGQQGVVEEEGQEGAGAGGQEGWSEDEDGLQEEWGME